jgi:hypothetical protein
MDEREMEEEGKNREREEWGRVIKILFFGMDRFYVCMKVQTGIRKPVGQIKLINYHNILAASGSAIVIGILPHLEN